MILVVVDVWTGTNGSQLVAFIGILLICIAPTWTGVGTDVQWVI